MFNVRLLDTHPDVYRLFVMDIELADRRLTNALAHILGHVRQCGAIAPTVTILARSHRVFRLIERHYEARAKTLVWTLRRSLGDGFTVDVERAWMGALWGTRRRDDLSAPEPMARYARCTTCQRASVGRKFNVRGAMRRVVSN